MFPSRFPVRYEVLHHGGIPAVYDLCWQAEEYARLCDLTCGCGARPHLVRIVA